ncbi:hypothetical protein [Pseudoalteromonas luteoviolacea]|uniref:hypothetical protein n=1 Tax=Pseudoalteromonas luteoviolacea TaxID=43657 RepID=UPI001B38FA60|nr:hypothetical protein [Pseudoalteromonas luteoviolacea]MBQ4837361.1 hypothetical protein [Pseudoalteromonas luteoviolacea]
MKKIVSVSMVAVLTMLSCLSFSSEDEKKETVKPEPFFLTQRGLAIEEDFAQCRDRCCRQRRACFDNGEETEDCESKYDSCAARCK